MPYMPYGVGCKTPNCQTAIILGDVWVPDRPLVGGDRIELLVLRPTRVRCQTCENEHEYDQADLRRFPEIPPLHG